MPRFALTRILSPARLAGLRAGRCWWPAEIAMRALGVASLLAASHVILAERQLAITPTPHDPTAADLAFCAAFVWLLSLGLTFTLWGPRLLLDVALPGHFHEQPRR